MRARRKASISILVRTDPGMVFNKSAIDPASLQYVRLPSGEIRPLRAAIYLFAEQGALRPPAGRSAHHYAAEHGAQVSHLFLDDAELASSRTGYCRSFLPAGEESTLTGFRNLMTAARDGQFEILIIDERGAPWARNKPVATEAFCILSECGVEVHTVGRGKWSLKHAASAALDDEAFGFPMQGNFESRQADRRLA
jgi:hypothetical protein